MKKRSARLSKILRLAAAEERHYGQLTGHSQLRLNEQRARLGELNAYRHDYAGKAQSNARLQSAHWKDYHNFLARLDDAVRAQRAIVRECEQTLESHRRQWLDRRQRVESLEKVRTRFRRDEAAHADRVEQRRIDDRPAAAPFYEEDG